MSNDQSLQAQFHNDSSQSSQISQQSSQDSVTSGPPQSSTPNTDDSMLPREVRITKHVCINIVVWCGPRIGSLPFKSVCCKRGLKVILESKYMLMFCDAYKIVQLY